MRCDLADTGSLRAAVEPYGRIDVAFNNGATIHPPGPMDQLAEAEFDRVGRLTAQNRRGSDRAAYATGAVLRVDGGCGPQPGFRVPCSPRWRQLLATR